MQYRALGGTGSKVSALGLGTEYLINLPREHVVGVVQAAIEQGVNYFDLFFAQAEFRDTMGVAFQGRRDKVLLAAHLGSMDKDGQYEKTRDLDLSKHFFDDFLERYRTGYVDVLYLHNCDSQEDYDVVMADGGLLGLARRLKAEGKARAIGFSGHTVSTAEQAVVSGEIDVLMFPVNLAGSAVPGKHELFQACVTHNIGLVAMKPYAGGKLLQPDQVVAMESFQSGGSDMELAKPGVITPVQCLSYVLAQVGVSTIVPGCKDLNELGQALAIWGASEEEQDFSAAVAGFQQYVSGECVYCNHCLPCPSTIDIGATIRLFEMAQSQLTPDLRAQYDALESNASDCVQCGACEERCPFGVTVMERMEQAVELFE